MCSLERRTTAESSWRLSMVRLRMQWDRDDAMFIGVSDVTRFMLPRNKSFSASSSVPTSYTLRFCRCRRPPLPSNMCTFFQSSRGSDACSLGETAQ